EPHTRLTHGARSKIPSPSCCATQPSTPMTCPAACLVRYSPSREKTFCAAFSRMLHVLYKIKVAVAGDSTCLYPRESSTPATFSESWSFIWQQNVARKKVAPLCGELADEPAVPAFSEATERPASESKLMSNVPAIVQCAV